MRTKIKVKLSDEILEEFIRLMEDVRDNQFKIGDMLIDLVEQHNGDKAGVINHIAGKLNISASALYDYYRISEKWQPIYREMYQSLDWTIYRNADPIEDRELLERCIDEGWNASRFKEEKYPAIIAPEAVLQKTVTSLDRLLDRNKQQLNEEIVDSIKDIKARIESVIGWIEFYK